MRLKKLLMLLVVLILLVLTYHKVIGSLNPVTQGHPGEKSQESFKDTIPQLIIYHDEDGDGINDLEDILQGARLDVANKPAYKSVYYDGGYPPDHEGVCTDVIWRAFMNAGYNFKKMIDNDIKNNTQAYPRVEGRPEPNIDFRRVPNQMTFFERHATKLTTEINPYDKENLEQWQGGDIVVFGQPVEHIGIVSDIRRGDGIPFMIHNAGPYAREEDALLYWHENISEIIGHYRWPNL